MSQKVWIRRKGAAIGAPPPASDAGVKITSPSEDAEVVKAECDSFTLASFTVADAWDLGHLLHAKLSPIGDSKPVLISIALANSQQIVFQCVTGGGVAPDNAIWVQRKRNSVFRWGCSTWFLHCKYGADEAGFYAKFGMSPDQASTYAIHGGAVPIKVPGVDGVVAVVVVSGLKQHEDHGVIVDVIRENWE